MKVFIVERGCRYEGVGLVGMYTSEEKALAKVEQILNEDKLTQEENYELFGKEDWYELPDLWENPDIWKWERGCWEIMHIREGVVE